MRALSLDLEQRRLVWSLFDRLAPAERVEFLRRACKRARGMPGVEVKVTGHTGTAREAYFDLMALEYEHGLDLGRAVAALERFVRKKER